MLKKISLIFIVVGIIGASAFVYLSKQNFALEKKLEPSATFVVERGRIQKMLEADDAKVAAEQEFNLGFPLSGIVEEIFVKKGDRVATATPLAKLDTTELELEAASLRALYSQRQSNLKKLLAGATKEDIFVLETKVQNAEIAVEDANRDLTNKVRDAYTKSDDAIRTKMDGILSSPRSLFPQINFYVSEPQIENAVESELPQIEALLSQWNLSLSGLDWAWNLQILAGEAKTNLSEINRYLNVVAPAVAAAIPSTAPTQTTIDTWTANISTARTNINTAITNLATAEEKLRTAESALALARSEMDFKKAGTRVEDIAAARADIDEINSRLAAVKDRIKKSTLLAPNAENIVEKVWFEVREFYATAKPAVTLSSPRQKIQADIAEDDIGEIKIGGEVLVSLDALPNQTFNGEIISIEPKEIIKNIDEIFYRVNVGLGSDEAVVRSGMSAKLEIKTLAKDNALIIPSAAAYNKGGKKFVKVLLGDAVEEREIEPGISNGESLEVVHGLNEKEVVLLF